MKKFFTFLCCFVLSFSIYAQDEAIFKHYHISPILLNPSLAGFNDSHQLMLNAQSSWTGFPGAPKTFNVNYNGPIGNKFGLGVSLLSDNIAAFSRIKGQLNYAFRFDLKRNVRLAVGFSTQYQTLSIDMDATDGSFYEAGDDIFDAVLDGRGDFDASLGAYALFDEKTYIGLSFTNMVSSRLNDIETDGRNFLSTYALLGGHRFLLEDIDAIIEPSILMLAIPDTDLRVDLNVKGIFLDEALTAGLSYRNWSILSILLGTKLDAFQFFYSYDFSFQRSQTYHSGAHEVSVLFDFSSSLKRKRRK